MQVRSIGDCEGSLVKGPELGTLDDVYLSALINRIVSYCVNKNYQTVGVLNR